MYLNLLENNGIWIEMSSVIVFSIDHTVLKKTKQTNKNKQQKTNQGEWQE